MEYIAKNKKIPTGTRSFERYLILRATTRRDKFNCLPCETDEKVRAQHRQPKVQRDDHRHKKRHAENKIVCLGIFATTLRRLKYSEICNKKCLTYFHSASLVV